MHMFESMQFEGIETSSLYLFINDACRKHFTNLSLSLQNWIVKKAVWEVKVKGQGRRASLRPAMGWMLNRLAPRTSISSFSEKNEQDISSQVATNLQVGSGRKFSRDDHCPDPCDGNPITSGRFRLQ